jgi:hypothetical protein
MPKAAIAVFGILHGEPDGPRRAILNTGPSTALT